jgi:hypothetical protein
MKKLLAFFIVLSFLIPSVFADLTVKGNAYGQLNVLQVYDEQTKADDDDVYAKLSRSDDGGDGVRLRVDLTGSAAEGLAGYRLQLHWHTEKNTFASGDFAYAWLKPLGNDFLQVNFGKFVIDDLRGKMGGGAVNFGAWTAGARSGEDEIFRRFQADATGLGLISKPIENLTIGFVVKDFASTDAGVNHKTNGDNGARAQLEDTSKAGAQWGKFHLAAGYTIPGIGLARLGFLAADQDTHQNDWTTGKAKGIPYSTGPGGVSIAEKSGWTAFPTGHLIQAAFQLKALESVGLKTLDFGFSIPIGYKVGANNTKFKLKDEDGNEFLLGDDSEWQAPLNLSLGAEYGIGDFGARLRTDLFFAGSVKYGEDLEKLNLPLVFDLHLAPYYTIQNIGKVGLEFGFNAYGSVSGKYAEWGKKDSKDDDYDGGVQQLGFGAWFEKSLAGGTFRIGLTYMVPLDPVGSYVLKTDKELDLAPYKDDKTPGIFTIPVYFEVAF